MYVGEKGLDGVWSWMDVYNTRLFAEQYLRSITASNDLAPRSRTEFVYQLVSVSMYNRNKKGSNVIASDYIQGYRR